MSSVSLTVSQHLLQYVTVMIGVAYKGVPVAGIIRKPFSNETLVGVSPPGTRSNYEGKGLTLLRIGDDSPFEKIEKPATSEQITSVTVSRSFWGKMDAKKMAYFLEFIKSDNSPRVSPAGGAGYKSWEVVTGKSRNVLNYFYRFA